MTTGTPPGRPAVGGAAAPEPGHAPADATRRSLLVRAQAGDPAAWEALTTVYRPLLVGWLRRQEVPAGEVDDLVQEVLLAVVRSLPGFTHSGQVGAFRAWLRTITCHRTLDYFRAAGRDRAAGADLSQVADPDGDLGRRWDEEHDRYVLGCLVEAVAGEFEPATLAAFRRVALDDAPAAAVAAELGLSVGAVYVAKSRVLQRIRQEAGGLID